MTYEEIVRGLRDSTYELHNEGRLVRAGLKTEQDTASIIERYAWLYAGGLTQVTGFVYDLRGWQFDRDPGFYSGDYLRAWIAEAALERGLRGRFGERWWATAEAGDWLRQQWRRGWEPEAEETVAEVGGKPWSGDALLERLEQRLPIAVP